MKNSDMFKQLRSATTHVIVPWGMEGLSRAASMAEEMVHAFPAAFYNIPPRALFSSDAEFVGVVISILKKRAGMKGAAHAISLIDFLEKENAH